MKRNNFQILSDTHFGHNMLIEKGIRPLYFEDRIIESVWDLPEKDILIHIGDVSFYKNKYWHEHFLKNSGCRRNILVLGNHDRETLTWYYDRGWSFVCNEFILEVYGYRLLLSHKPVDAAQMMASSANINIHGHIHHGDHREYNPDTFHELVSIEDTLAPIKLKTVVERFERKLKRQYELDVKETIGEIA